MRRRAFVHAALAAAPLAAAPLAASALPVPKRIARPSPPPERAIVVRAGEDRFNENLLIGGTNAIDCKVSAADTGGAFSAFWIEVVGQGGPDLHVHHDQDEWFYVERGRFVLRVGEEEFRLEAGDSALAPRDLPHTWANVGEEPGRMLMAFQPAGLMEPFFREASRFTAENFPSPEEVHRLYRSHGMEVVGPPLAVDR